MKGEGSWLTVKILWQNLLLNPGFCCWGIKFQLQNNLFVWSVLLRHRGKEEELGTCESSSGMWARSSLLQLPQQPNCYYYYYNIFYHQSYYSLKFTLHCHFGCCSSLIMFFSEDNRVTSVQFFLLSIHFIHL